MNKEFEALERLKTAPSFMGGTEKYRFSMNSVSALLEDYELVKQALTELQAIKESEPSEAMKCLEEIGKTLMFTNPEPLESEPLKEAIPNFYKTVEQALIQAKYDREKASAFDVLKKYAKNDGWSNGWCIEFYKMTEEEIKLVNERLKTQ